MEDGSPLQVAIHDGEKDLKKKIHRINKYREEVQPCFTGHHGGEYLFGAKRLPRGIESELITGIRGCEGKEGGEEGSILITTSGL